MKLLLCCVLFLPTMLMRAEGEAELREAVGALARSSYTWETTTRQRFRAQAAEPRPDPNTPIAVRGEAGAEGLARITLEPSRELAVPVTAVFRYGDVVAGTPLGWLRRPELRRAEADREVTFEGKPVRLSRVLGVALKASALRPLAEDLLDMIADLKSCRRGEGGLLLGELREKTIEEWWGEAQAKRAPEVHGTVIFKLGPAGLAEYHVVLGIGFPDRRTQAVAWTMQQWSTRIRDIGTTAVAAPPGALEALDK
jgi:hypothetical protein